MSVDTVIEKVGLRGVKSVNQAIVAVSEYLYDKDEDTANKLIKEMGGQMVASHPVDADIMLKCMIERAVAGTFVDVAESQEYGREKIAKLRRSMPFVFVQKVEEAPVESVPGKKQKGARNSKNASSFEFVSDMIAKGVKDRGLITKALATELDLDYAGAFFYVKKAEKALGITLPSARKGKKK